MPVPPERPNGTASTQGETVMIVVTGATGNIGRHLVAALAAAGEGVRAVARRPPDTGAPEGVEYRAADLSRAADLPSVVEGADALFLLLGPELSAGGEAAAIGAAPGTGVGFVGLTREQAREHLVAAMPAPVADGTLDILGAPTSEEVLVSPGVDKVLGRAPAGAAAG
jgi:uncharacterized protein YbjT (DUF2867 family)